MVTTACVYHHVLCGGTRELLISETKRVLRPGEISCVIEHNTLNPVTRLIVKQTPLDANARLMTAWEAALFARRCD